MHRVRAGSLSRAVHTEPWRESDCCLPSHQEMKASHVRKLPETGALGKAQSFTTGHPWKWSLSSSPYTCNFKHAQRLSDKARTYSESNYRTILSIMLQWKWENQHKFMLWSICFGRYHELQRSFYGESVKDDRPLSPIDSGTMEVNWCIVFYTLFSVLYTQNSGALKHNSLSS